ncbi:unnamed protein product [Rhodiola kirilowii]
MADQRVLEINVAYAQGLKDVNLFTKMDVYVTVSIVGGNNNSNIKQKTNVDRDSGTHPTWNFPMRFKVDDLQGRSSLFLFFKLKCEGSLADTDIGEVCVPIKDLLDSSSVSCESKSSKFVHYQVTTPSGKGQGTLTFSYKFLEKVFGAQTVEPVERAAEATQQPTTYLPPQQPMEPSLSHCGFSCQDTLYRPTTYPQTPVPIYSYPAALPEQVLGSGYVYPPAPNSYPPHPDPTTGFVYIYPPPQSAAPNYAYVPYQQQPLQQLVCPPTSSGGQSVYPYPPQADHKYGCPPQAYPGYW